MNKEKAIFLVDTGAEVSLISSSTPGLVISDSQVSPVSITHQPITVRGEAEVTLELGGVQTKWNFLVVDDLRESVLGADFIESHHESSWGIRDGVLWLDDWKIPLVNHCKCSSVWVENYSPVVARCTVELPARNQVLIPMRTKDGDCRVGLFEIWNTQTTPFHPQSDGASERSIRTVNSMLAKIVTEDQRNWDLYIPSTCLAYNTSVHSSTGFTPSFLRFGRELRLPSDLLQPDSRLPLQEFHSDYATELKSRLMQAFQTASETLKVSNRTQKAYYDRWARANAYQVGDRVLWLDKKSRRGRCMKLNRPWTGPWIVIKRLSEVVYRIKYCGPTGSYSRVKRRVVHFNQLKPFVGASDKGQGGAAIETGPTEALRPSSTQASSDAGLIVLEDDIFPEGVVDPVPVQHPSQAEEPVRRSQRERRPPLWTRDYQMDT